MEIHIKKVEQIPFEGFADLLRESKKEGYNFLVRLATEWESGKNRFSRPGEGLYMLLREGQAVGIGGINRDPFSNEGNIGRIRRFYLKAACRGQGLGGLLLNKILDTHGRFFAEIGLRTDSEKASAFYEKHGFQRITAHPHISHIMVRLPDE